MSGTFNRPIFHDSFAWHIFPGSPELGGQKMGGHFMGGQNLTTHQFSTTHFPFFKNLPKWVVKRVFVCANIRNALHQFLLLPANQPYPKNSHLKPPEPNDKDSFSNDTE
jgi:hypothetical protein